MFLSQNLPVRIVKCYLGCKEALNCYYYVAFNEIIVRNWEITVVVYFK